MENLGPTFAELSDLSKSLHAYFVTDAAVRKTGNVYAADLLFSSRPV